LKNVGSSEVNAEYEVQKVESAETRKLIQGPVIPGSCSRCLKCNIKGAEIGLSGITRLYEKWIPVETGAAYGVVLKLQ